MHFVTDVNKLQESLQIFIKQYFGIFENIMTHVLCHTLYNAVYPVT